MEAMGSIVWMDMPKSKELVWVILGPSELFLRRAMCKAR